MFGQDKEMGARDSDDNLYTPIGFDEDMPKYREFQEDDDGFTTEFVVELAFRDTTQLKDVI